MKMFFTSLFGMLLLVSNSCHGSLTNSPEYVQVPDMQGLEEHGSIAWDDSISSEPSAADATGPSNNTGVRNHRRSILKIIALPLVAIAGATLGSELSGNFAGDGGRPSSLFSGEGFGPGSSGEGVPRTNGGYDNVDRHYLREPHDGLYTERKFLDGNFDVGGTVKAKLKIGQQNGENGEYDRDGTATSKSSIGQQNIVERGSQVGEFQAKFSLPKTPFSMPNINVKAPIHGNGDESHDGDENHIGEQHIGQQNNLGNNAQVGQIGYSQKYEKTAVDVGAVQEKFLDGNFQAGGGVKAKEVIGQKNGGDGTYRKRGNRMAKTHIGQQNNVQKDFTERSVDLKGLQEKFSLPDFFTGALSGNTAGSSQTIGQQNNIEAGAHVGSITYNDGNAGATAVQSGGTPSQHLNASTTGSGSGNSKPKKGEVVGQENNFGPNTHIGSLQIPMPDKGTVDQGKLQATKAGVPFVKQKNTFSGGHFHSISGSAQGGLKVVKNGQQVARSALGSPPALQNTNNSAVEGIVAAAERGVQSFVGGSGDTEQQSKSRNLLKSANLNATQGKYLDGETGADKGPVRVASANLNALQEKDIVHCYKCTVVEQQNNVNRGGRVGKIVHSGGGGYSSSHHSDSVGPLGLAGLAGEALSSALSR